VASWMAGRTTCLWSSSQPSSSPGDPEIRRERADWRVCETSWAWRCCSSENVSILRRPCSVSERHRRSDTASRNDEYLFHCFATS